MTSCSRSNLVKDALAAFAFGTRTLDPVHNCSSGACLMGATCHHEVNQGDKVYKRSGNVAGHQTPKDYWQFSPPPLWTEVVSNTL